MIRLKAREGFGRHCRIARLVTLQAGRQNSLPRLLAAADNAAMPTEPPRVNFPKRKRRWLHFRLRTLMIGLAALLLLAAAGWCANQARRARARTSILETIREHGGDYQQHLGAIPKMSFVRRLCGDQCVVVVWRPRDGSGPTEDEIRAEFPKVQILVASDDRP
jgi:hypothetical protein